MKEMTVIEAKRFGVITCRTTATLMSVACTMQENNISALVVVDGEGYLAGVITRTDLVRAGYEQPEWQQQPVRAYMNGDVVTVNLDDRLEKVMALLIERHIHRVVAVKPFGDKLKPVGVLSAADIIYHMASCR
ncbi:MAG: CBS domain-containing protein [Caldilinea sp.]|uniref:CBS domain-containing protein n=1 Tax=Caldilinea sp. TaxID=2293560 RepID=UPI002CB906B8|nr:CBS domain-containing protein [Anaerolineales bacterium]HQY93197.1 CBS domain-containing protein [Caldilinea sp.]HRA69033.1 CBS domain-containing protein [Caldilinea sp.]